MGNYNYQYQNYYKYMTHKNRPGISYNNSNSTGSILNNLTYKKLIKKIAYQIIGVLILTSFIMGCKLIVTPQTNFICKYSKRILNESFDYKTAWKEIRKVKWSDAEKFPSQVINEIKKNF